MAESDVGKLFKIPQGKADQLCFNVSATFYVQIAIFKKTLPSPLIKQMDTLGELVLMLRSPLLEISACMDAVRPSFPALRTVLWGGFGTGKSTTLNQAVYIAHEKNWVIVNLRSAMDLTRKVDEVEMSSFKPGRINDPVNAGLFLQQFKQQVIIPSFPYVSVPESARMEGIV